MSATSDEVVPPEDAALLALGMKIARPFVCICGEPGHRVIRARCYSLGGAWKSFGDFDVNLTVYRSINEGTGWHSES